MSPRWLEAVPRPELRATTNSWQCLPGCQISMMTTVSPFSLLSACPQWLCQHWETLGWSRGPGSELILSGSLSSPSSLTLTFQSPLLGDTVLLSDPSSQTRIVLMSWFKLWLKLIHICVLICIFRLFFFPKLVLEKKMYGKVSGFCLSSRRRVRESRFLFSSDWICW